MEKKYSRREVLGFGAIAGTTLLGACSSKTGDKAVFPWKYKILDVEKTRQRAYKSYFKGGCMYGVFEAIAGQVGEALGKPYCDFPFELSTYGGGGAALWGTLCGTCNGAAMAIAMFHGKPLCNQLVNEVFSWYEGTALPIFVPAEPDKVKKDYQMPTSKAESTLCHVSVTRWVQAAGKASFSPERAERCARVVADMAGFTAGLLNLTAQDKFTPKNQVSAAANDCLACHAKGKQAPNEPEVVSKMSCATCHPDSHK
ncbi:MAG: C_GCAxxG_C_C family protein [Candidatus Aminicenantes bacterium]|nr:C_GCAxxG_C_C family protein [Candidatus Aminicenantes bacterium]